MAPWQGVWLRALPATITMKAIEKRTKTTVVAGRLARQPLFLGPTEPLFSTRDSRSQIQWPTEQDIREVSTRLIRIARFGMRSEAQGDYFTSGDLAYQMREIIQATAELFRKGQRLKR